MLYAGYGFAGGFFFVLVTVAWPRLYGVKNLGAINGMNTSMMVFISALGPVLFSTVQGAAGSYMPVIVAWCFVPMALLISALWADNPQDQAGPAQGA